MESYFPPSEVDEKTVDGVLSALREYFVEPIKASSKPALNLAVKAHISKRVPPGAVKRYQSVEMATQLAIFDLEEIGGRIRNYQYIERYRYFFSTDDKGMFVAFLQSTYALRGVESYVVLERGRDLIDFFFSICENLGIKSTNMSKDYFKDFRKEFDSRLRERHRMTHAHERPSLLSRFLAIPPASFQKPEFAKTITDMALNMGEALAALQSQPGKPGKNPLSDMDGFRTEYLKRVDAEAAKMWQVLIKRLGETVGAKLS